MAFKFNEVNASQGSVKKAKAVSAKMDTITTKAQSYQYWAGFNAAEAQQLYRELYDLGDIVTAHYFVLMKPHNENETKNLAFFTDNLTGYLVTETNLSVIEAEYEQVKAGAFYYNSLSGFQEPDLQLTFVETKDTRILNSFLQWRELMVNDDGSLNPPASYAMEITVGLFSREFGMSYKPFEKTYLVAPTLSAIDNLVSNNYESLRVPAALKVLRPYSLTE
ncbi:hypothetical protein [Acinetobacter seifertii]|uniref:hypothetical protein n=1 Tax=Acinetobacter seifertii TaxID=1530123 RepID=UPI001905DF9E|nr:hypothetical protein [Acinetobacter seifertii]MBJ9425134.1 hypothetical protein [Acinetobacter seifertii]